MVESHQFVLESNLDILVQNDEDINQRLQTFFFGRRSSHDNREILQIIISDISDITLLVPFRAGYSSAAPAASIRVKVMTTMRMIGRY